MAIGDPFPGAGITNIIGQQGNPMGGVVESRSSNMFNPNETPEDAVLRLWQANAGIDQIAQLTGIPSPQIAQIINNYTGADTRMNNQFIQPLPAGAGVETEFEQETITDLPFEQIDTEQITTRPDLISDGLGTQALMAMDSSLTENSPEVGEARNLEEKIIKTGTDVYGLNTEDPDVIQTGNVLSLDVLDGLQDDEEGISDDVKNQVLQDIGLNDVFTNENISMEDRIDFFKHYMAETLGLNYDDLKKSSDEGTPFLMAGAAMLQASKDGESRMAGLGKALISFGTTRSQLARIADKEAAAYMMKAFDLGLESHKIAQVGTKDGLGNIGQYIVPSVSSDPILMGDKEALAFQRAGLNLRKYSETKENPKRYAIPKWNANKTGVVYEYRTMSPTAAGNAEKQIDSDLLNAGYRVNEVDTTAMRTFGFIKSPDGEVEQISMQEYLTLPATDPRKEYEFTKAQDVQSVFDLEEGIAKFVSKGELLKNPRITLANGEEVDRYQPNTMLKTTTILPDGTVEIMEGGASGVKGYLGSRQQLGEIRETREKLLNLDLGTRKVLDNIDLVRGIARKGLFGRPAAVMSAFGNIIASSQEAYEVYRDDLVEQGRAIKGQTYDSLYENFKEKYEDQIMNYAWAPKLIDSGVQKDRITAAMFGLAISSAKLLAEQKGRDISNADIERFMQEIGANASSLLGFESIINDLEYKVLRNYQRQAGPDGIYRDTQLMIDNPAGPDLPQIGNLTVPGQYFAPGGRGEKTQAFIDERLKALDIETTQVSTATGGTVTVPPIDTYSSFSRKLRKDKSGAGDKLAKLESTGETVTWSKLAKQIIYDELHNDPNVAQQITIQRIKDAFPDTDAGIADMEEFMKWYTSF